MVGGGEGIFVSTASVVVEKAVPVEVVVAAQRRQVVGGGIRAAPPGTVLGAPPGRHADAVVFRVVGGRRPWIQSTRDEPAGGNAAVGVVAVARIRAVGRLAVEVEAARPVGDD